MGINQASLNSRRTKLYAPKPAVHAALNRSYDLHVATPGLAHFAPLAIRLGGAIALNRLCIGGGQIKIGDYVIHKPKFLRNTVSWSQVAGGIQCIGNLSFNANGTVLSGSIHAGKVGQPLHNAQVFGTMATTRFSTQYSADGKTWQAGPDMEIGIAFNAEIEAGHVQQNLSNVQQIVNVYACQNGGSYAPINFVPLALASFSTDPKSGNLEVLFPLNPVMFPPSCTTGSYTFPIPSGSASTAGSIIYSSDGSSFSGTVYDFTGSTAYTLTGSAVTTSIAEAAALPADFLDYRASGLGNLSVQDLASQTLPDVQSFSNAMLFDCLLYVMPADLRTNLTGRTQPTNLSTSTVSLISQAPVTDFLNNFYGPTYFGWGFANMTQFSSNFNASQSLQLEYTASDTLSKQSAFSLVNNAVYSASAIMSSARLSDYVNDTSTNWGAALYDYITQQNQVVQVQTEVFGANNSDTLNRFVSLLSVFDPSGKLPQQYYSAIMGAALLSQSTYFMDPGSSGNQSNLASILPQLLQQIINQWIVAPSDPTQGQVQQQLLAQALQEAADALGSIQALADQLVTAFSYGGDQVALAARLSRAYQYLTTNGSLPNAVKSLSKFLAPIGLGLGIYFTIVGIANWSNLTTSQQIAVVGKGLIALSALIEMLPEIVTAFVNGVTTGIAILAQLRPSWLGGAPMFEDFEVDLSGLTEENLVFNNDANENIGNIAEEDFAEQGDKLLFSYGTTFKSILKGVCVLGEVIVAGVAVYSFVEDILNGAPVSQIIFDGLQAFSLGVMAVCDVVQLFIESALAATLGVVFAIVGVVVAIIEIFVGKSDPPPTPAQQYVTSTILPFVTQQQAQNPVPQNWSLPTGPSEVGIPA